MIAEAEILRQPEHHRFVRDRVSRVNQELDQERQPKVALRAAQHGESSDEAAQSRRSDMLLRDYLFRCFGHRFSDDSRFLPERMRMEVLIKRAFHSDAWAIEHVRVPVKANAHAVFRRVDFAR